MWNKAFATFALLAIGLTMVASENISDSDSRQADGGDAVFYSHPEDKDRVINGMPAEREQLPWHVIINVNKGRGRLCAGSLISSSFVLTEANALYGAATFTCIFGAHFSGDRKVVRRSSKHISHPRHKLGSGNYNIGLLRLDRAFTDFTKKIFPVLLPRAQPANAEEMLYENRHAWISGFGSASGAQFPSNQWSTVRVLTNATCLATFPGVVPNVLCTVSHDGYHSGPGLGDGGAPLVALERGRYFQIGVYAFSYRNDFTRPAGYIATFAPEIRRWINQHTTL